MVLVVKNPPANTGDTRDMGEIPGSGRCPGGGHGTLLQYSCLENSMGRGAWWATVHGATKSQTASQGWFEQGQRRPSMEGLVFLLPPSPLASRCCCGHQEERSQFLHRDGVHSRNKTQHWHSRAAPWLDAGFYIMLKTH